MDINERLEELRAQRDDLRTQVDDVQRSYELVCERIMGIEEALNDTRMRDSVHRGEQEKGWQFVQTGDPADPFVRVQSGTGKVELLLWEERRGRRSE